MPNYILRQGGVGVQMDKVLSDADSIDAEPERSSDNLASRGTGVANDVNGHPSAVGTVSAAALRFVPSD